MFWNYLVHDMEEVRKTLDQAFNGRSTHLTPSRQHSFLPGHANHSYPLINMYQDENNVVIEALTPGLDSENLEVSVLNNTLTISGEKLSAKEDFDSESIHRSERAAGKFVRTLELTTPIDEDKIKADYINGILTMTLPRTEQAKPRRIAVTAG